MRSLNGKSRVTFSALTVIGVLFWASVVRTQTTSFTYQGRLTDGGTPANGSYDLQFALWDSAAGGMQIGATQTVNSVAVSGGIFTVTLDFGANAFPGASRFLEMGTPGSCSTYSMMERGKSPARLLPLTRIVISPSGKVGIGTPHLTRL